MNRLTTIAATTALIIVTAQAQGVPSQFALESHLFSAAQRPPMDSVAAEHTEPIPLQFDLQDQLIAQSDVSTAPDSIAAPPKSRLLPANVSFMEKTLWGEDGIVRGLGLEPPLTPDERRSELSLRRTMLTTHQIGGFVTLGLMGGAIYFGQKIIDGHPEYRRNHQYWVTATIISYSATGLLAILSPPPLIRRNEVSTTTIHKTLAWIHVAGMIITPILGGMIQRRSKNAMQSERVHQVSAYLTTATFAASLIVVTF
jgi:hypothetical protein